MSCSGKTTLARALGQILPGAALLPLDAYYRDLSELSPQARAASNFDAPAALDFPLLLAQLQALARGRAVEHPRYDFTTHTRRPDTQHLFPPAYLLVEGLFALYWPEIRALYQLAVFVEAPHQLCLQRRLQRDVAERGRIPQTVRHQYQSHVRPMAEKYILPTRRHATLSVDGAAPDIHTAAHICTLLG